MVVRSLSFVFGALILAACSSVPDVTFADGDGGTGEGGSSGSSGSSGGPCTPTGAEICDDGVDNDCNGSVDCADPACGAFACVEPAPAGWQLVAFSAASRPPCPQGMGASKDVVSVEGDGGVSCDCSCDTGSCAAGKYSVISGNNPACTDAPQTLNTNQTTCATLPGGVGLNNGQYARITPPAVPATCPASAKANIAALAQGRTCEAAKVGLGCGGTQVCAPKVAPFEFCIARAGAQACPAGYQLRRAGASASDTRACSACVCSPTPCTGSITIFQNNACLGNSVQLAANDQCAQISGPNNPGSYRSTVTGGCQVTTTSQPSGAVTFTDEQTVCCK